MTSLGRIPNQSPWAKLLSRSKLNSVAPDLEHRCPVSASATVNNYTQPIKKCPGKIQESGTFSRGSFGTVEGKANLEFGADVWSPIGP